MSMLDNGYDADAFVGYTVKVHSHERQRLCLHVRLRQDDNIVSMRTLRQNAKNGCRTHSLHLTQGPHKHVAI